MKLEEIRSDYRDKLVSVMSPAEAEAVTFRVFEQLLGLKRVDLVLKKELLPDAEVLSRLEVALQRLLSGEPVQYVLETAPFFGRDFYVNPAVLIPRPETEELVQWMLESTQGMSSGRMIDLGTGSGCIPVTFALERPEWKVTAADISPSALAVAERNANQSGAAVSFRLLDMLAYDAHTGFEPASVQLLVSNPPYIPESEAPGLEDRVKLFEPSLALFTPEDDPQLFYRAIQRLAAVLLAPGGLLFLEVHERHARETLRLFTEESFSGTELRTDLSGKPRMIRARRSAS